MKTLHSDNMPEAKVKCPNCGFENRKRENDCVKCGIVFAKFTARLEGREKLFLSSKIPYDADNFFIKLIYPIAVGKGYVEVVYRKILGMLWNELFKGESDLSQGGNFLAFALFCVFSFLMLHIEEYIGFIILILASVWILDVYLAKQRYRHCRQNEKIRLVKNSRGQLVLRKITSDGKLEYEANLSPSEVDHISIFQFNRTGGAFKESVATVWRSSIGFMDGSELLLSEDKDLRETMQKARKVSKLLGIQYKFKYGQDYAASTLSQKAMRTDDSIRVESKADGLNIYTKLSSTMRLRFVVMVLKESGFFLFLLIVAEVMIKFGALLSFLYARFYGSGMPNANFVPNFVSILSIFKPELNVLDGIEYAIAMALLMRKTWLLARPQYVSIDAEKIRYYVNDNLTGECKTREIDTISLLNMPEPTIVVLNSNASIEVRNLRSIQEFKSFFIKIREGVERFYAKPKKTGVDATPSIAFNPDVS
jgi:hypothetical protein